MIRNLHSHEGSDQFENFNRMSREDFEYLVSQLTLKIEKQTTHFNKPIAVNESIITFLSN